MPNIRQRIGEVFIGDELQRIRQTTQRLIEAYQQGPFELPPEMLVAQLKEVDSSYLVDLVNQALYDQVGTFSTMDTLAEMERARNESRRLWKYDVITQRIIKTWTDFAFGLNLVVTPEDPAAAEVWNEFWEADRNSPLLADDRLHRLSENLLVDGERFLVFFISTLDGLVTVREIMPEEIKSIITHPEDATTPLFYERIWSDKATSSKTGYYPDWLALVSGALDEDYVTSNGNQLNGNQTLAQVALPKSAVRMDTYKEGTVVCILHIAHSVRDGLRGWPLMTAGASWSREHKRFRENRASVAAAMAMYVRKLKAKTGSRGIEALRKQLNSNLSTNQFYDTNPPPTAGSTFIENDAAEMTTMPLSTAAGDARVDGEALLMMAGLAGGLFPHWLGAGEAFRLATATAMETPVRRQFTRYQLFWAAQWQRMARIVFWAAEEYGGKVLEERAVDVSTDKILESDLGALTSAMNSSVSAMLMPAIAANLIPKETATNILSQLWRVVLQTLGVSNADVLTDEKAFPIPEQVPAPPGGPAEGFMAERLKEFTPGMGLEEIQDEYRETLNQSMSDYLDSDRPITSFRNEFRRAVNDAFSFAFIAGYADAGGAHEEMPEDSRDWVIKRIEDEIGYADELFISLKNLREDADLSPDEKMASIERHAAAYTATLLSIYNEGLLHGDREKELTFEGEDGLKSCNTCQELKGVTHPASWWIKEEMLPGPTNPRYECGGFECKHYLVDKFGNRYTVAKESEKGKEAYHVQLADGQPQHGSTG